VAIKRNETKRNENGMGIVTDEKQREVEKERDIYIHKEREREESCEPSDST